ncbi:MAG: hypothetical protein DHS20C21_09650 [Gemmatimonadota bacterium]|nr:MAG: hypothetical protein DHS20C21_09650 [Gemmatimonadota bacterium]
MSRVILLAAILVMGASLPGGAVPAEKREAVHPDAGGERVATPQAPILEKVPAIEGAGGPHRGRHEPKHGGALVPLGEDHAHLEFVLEPATGLLTMYVLDGEAGKPKRLQQEMVFAKITTDAEEFAMVLFAQGDSETGEQLGDTAFYQAAHRKLEGQAGFDAVLEGVTIGRQSYRRVSFRYPLGTETLP